MFSKPNILQEKRRAEMRAFSVNENIHPIWGGGLLLLFTADLFGSGYLNYNHPIDCQAKIAQCTIFYKKRATKKRERIWN